MIKTLVEILKNAYNIQYDYVKVDFDILGIAKDFLLENNEIEKANGLDFLIKNKKIPFLTWDKQFEFIVGSNKYPFNLPFLQFQFFAGMMQTLKAKTFPKLIWETLLSWEMTHLSNQVD